MHHIDLFSGIGGFALAAEAVWPGMSHTFVEYDGFCQNVLMKHWPNSKIYGDIRGWQPTEPRPFILTGGFPCQPFSSAGRRRGTSDDRYLWPEMLRIIRATVPSWVIAENVRGLASWNGGMVLETVCADLEVAGYEVQPFIIPACAVGAPHRRDRIWIVAHAARVGRGQGNQDAGGRGAGKGSMGKEERRGFADGGRFPDWSRDWREVAAETCVHRVDDGVSERVARLPDGTEISEARLRKESLKAYGNAIVPQVAIEIMRAIADIEN